MVERKERERSDGFLGREEERGMGKWSEGKEQSPLVIEAKGAHMDKSFTISHEGVVFYFILIKNNA